MTAPAQTKVRTRESKGVRRMQLIEATITEIAKNGLSATTLSRVSKTAGLSQGIVNLHFQSKDNLLAETLKFVQDEYETTWRSALDKAGKPPACQLAALMRADYKAKIVDSNKLAVWFAFWGEVKSRPTYHSLCRERMNGHADILEDIISKLITEGNYGDLGPASTLAGGLAAMADGLWLNMLINSKTLNRKSAQQAMMSHLAILFPDHKDAFLG